MSAADNFRAERIALCGRAIESAPPAGRWWPGLAPLTKPERAVVLAEVKRRREKAAEAEEVTGGPMGPSGFIRLVEES